MKITDTLKAIKDSEKEKLVKKMFDMLKNKDSYSILETHVVYNNDVEIDLLAGRGNCRLIFAMEGYDNLALENEAVERLNNARDYYEEKGHKVFCFYVSPNKFKKIRKIGII